MVTILMTTRLQFFSKKITKIVCKTRVQVSKYQIYSLLSDFSFYSGKLLKVLEFQNLQSEFFTLRHVEILACISKRCAVLDLVQIFSLSS